MSLDAYVRNLQISTQFAAIKQTPINNLYYSFNNTDSVVFISLLCFHFTGIFYACVYIISIYIHRDVKIIELSSSNQLEKKVKNVIQIMFDQCIQILKCKTVFRLPLIRHYGLGTMTTTTDMSHRLSYENC